MYAAANIPRDQHRPLEPSMRSHRLVRVSVLALALLPVVGPLLAAQQAIHATRAAMSNGAPTRVTTTAATGYYSFGYKPGERVANV